MTEFINHFQHPWLLFLLPLPVIWVVWHYWRGGKSPSVMYSSLDIARGLPRTMRQRVLGLLPVSRALVLMLGIVALARPQYGEMEYDVNTMGMDIVLALDVSGSMQATDFQPNRLEAAKAAATEFVDNRETDRIAITLYGAETAVLSPFTLDMEATKTFLSSIYNGIIAHQATAIGDGIGVSAKLFEDSEAESKIILLLTDGENNTGKLEPLQATDIARALGIRIYTIGVGRDSRGGGFLGRPADFDSSVLEEIAERTDGQYFHATNERALTEIYREIDEMEKTEIEVTEYANYSERFMAFWFPALALLLLEFVLRALWLRRLP